MNPVLAGLCAACLVVGLLLVSDGVRPRERAQSTGGSTPLWTTARRWWTNRTRLQQIHWLVAMSGALVLFLVTGWPVVLVAVPLVAIGLPALLAEPGNRDIETLEALDRWVRALAASLPTGKSITDAMRSTTPQAPVAVQPALRVMVARLDQRWTTREALLALADDLDSPDADAVVAALVLAAQRGGVGAVTTLNQLADSIQTRLRALREIEAERAKPRVVVRQVTVISIVVISAALVLQPGYFSAYRSPVGQVVLGLLVSCYALSLLALRRMTMPRRRERILQHRDPSAPVAVPGGAPCMTP